ncbi:MAG TPA: DNA polymerase III subunit [Polyangiaceae bacterium]|nr:DNA polymerase III subunit [Polyangiaceae bacterium]
MGFADILGQAPAIETLRRALASGRLHHAYRFEGPPGVGKELAALAVAQTLVCETGGGEGCGRCGACRRAVTLATEEPRVPLHPDVVFVQRGLYRGILGSGGGEATGIGIEQIRRVVLDRVGFSPHEGRALVFIVRDADELTVQAANALLKTLEEPHAKTHFLLVTSRPTRLLDTIRSRTLPVRFGPLPDSVVTQILRKRGLDEAVAPLAQGSAALAIELAEPETKNERDEFVASARQAVAAPDLVPGLKFAESRPKARDGVRDQLAFLAQALATDGRLLVEKDPALAERRAREHALVLEAMDAVEKNVQPGLALEAMVVRLRQL